ncbi:hypothetical protein [Streptomyces sp. 039-1]|uniref:hypothetical protein n=1 Tax=Streptomyces sp. 039-1 TaxID=2789263 RepID=UPI0039F4C968
MPVRPELVRPDDASITEAMERTLLALAAVFKAIGPGQRALEIAMLRTDGASLRQTAEFSPTGNVQLSGILGEDDYYTLAMLLTFALEGSTVISATLIATVAAEPHPRTCGWTIRDGWLHPMSTTDVLVALSPSVDAEDLNIHTAPELPKPNTGQE